MADLAPEQRSRATTVPSALDAQAGQRRRPSSLAEDRIRMLRGFRPEIEGLRAVAVLLVVLFHAGVPVLPGGFVGVDVFFVISGFLITRLLLAELVDTGRISLPTFYLRRARRLLPALALVIAVTLVLSRVLASPFVTEDTAVDGMWASVYLVNFHFLAVGLDYFATDLPDSPLLHLWSLAVEEQFYLLWPAVLGIVAARRSFVALRRCAVAVTALGGASLAASVLLTASAPVFAYFLPVTRMWELCAGGLLAMCMHRLRRVPRGVSTAATWTGLAAIAIAATTLTSSTPFPGTAALLPVVGAALVIGFAGPDQRLLTHPRMQQIGTISYSLYLWHWPLLVLLAGAGGPTPRGLLVSLPVAVLSAVCAWLTYRVVEDPVRRSRWFARRARRGVALAVATTAIPVLAAGIILATKVEIIGSGAAVATPDLTRAGGAEERLRAAIEQSTKSNVVPRNLNPPLDHAGMKGTEIFRYRCHVKTYGARTSSPRCTYGDLTSPTTVVLYGDSHAAHWFPAMRDIAKRRHWRLVSLTRGSCPSIEVPVGRAQEGCYEWRTNTKQRIAKERPALVVLANLRAYCGSDACEQGTESMLRALHEAAPGAPVVYVEDTPHHMLNVKVCLAQHLSAIDACEATSAEDAERDIQRVVDADEGAVWVDTTNWYCAKGTCPVVIGNVLVAVDNDHMSIPMAEMLAPMLERRLVAAMPDHSAS